LAALYELQSILIKLKVSAVNITVKLLNFMFGKKVLLGILVVLKMFRDQVAHACAWNR